MGADRGSKKAAGLYVPILVLVFVSAVVYFYKSDIVKVLGGAPGLLGFFMLSFVACLSIIPIPYVMIVFKVARFLDPLPVSIVVGLGSALGEAVSWGIGRIAKHALKGTHYARRVSVLFELASRKGSWALPVLAFVFSLTFLPDKLLYLPLGMMGYSIWRLLPFTVLGKVLMMYLVMTFGRLWVTYVEGATNELISNIITTALLVAVSVALVYVDWEKVLSKRLEYLASEPRATA